MLWFWGVSGAFVYAANALIFSLWADGATVRSRLRGVAEFVTALITGAIFAQGFSGVAEHLIERWIKTEPVAVALTIGWASNYLWPKLLRKLGDRVEALPTKGA